jgi:hypothetical protein
MKRTTGSEFIKEVRQLFNPDPQKNDSKIANLLELLTNFPGTPMFQAKPTVNTQWPPPAPDTLENVAASINPPAATITEDFPYKKLKGGK